MYLYYNTIFLFKFKLYLFQKKKLSVNIKDWLKFLNKIINKKPIHSSKLAKAKIKKLSDISKVSSFILPLKIVKQYKISQINSE